MNPPAFAMQPILSATLAVGDPVFWPAPESFLELAADASVSAGAARCTGLAICDEAGQPTTVFEQGQTAHFYYEFEVFSDFEVVSGGLEFRDAVCTVHGKNTFQFGQPATAVVSGSRLRHHHTITLDVGPGEYVVTLGLAAVSAEDFEAYRDGRIGHETFSPRTQELCRVPDVASFCVRFLSSGELPHHGLVNLPGACTVASVLDAVSDDIERPIPAARATGGDAVVMPTLIHVTHWKAGSQWIRRILTECVPDLIVPPRIGEVQFVHWPIQAGRIYPTVYVTRQQFDQARLPENSTRFVVIRDLRDTLVSAYFSLRFSHTIEETTLAHLRHTLAALDEEHGLLHLIREWLPQCAAIQSSWFESGEPLIRYRDLLDRDLEILEPLLLDRCQLPVSRERFREVVMASRFENLTKCRSRGTEDVSAHERKGIAGDWQNHFTDRVKDAFKLRYGGLLVATGYEKDFDW